jgi:short-subunit dehydrogenase
MASLALMLLLWSAVEMVGSTHAWRILSLVRSSPNTGGFRAVPRHATATGLKSRLRVYSTGITPLEFCPKHVIWIVGTSSGIGQELAKQIPKNLHVESNTKTRLVLSARNVAALEQTAAECRQRWDAAATTMTSLEIVVLPLDVVSTSNFEPIFQQVFDGDDNSVITVYLNAGKGHLCPAVDTTSELVQDVMNSTVTWCMVLLPQLLRHQQNQSIHLVVTSSVAAHIPVPLSAVYAAAKHALHGYLTTLATERPDLYITMLCPGPVDTPFLANTSRDVPLSTTRTSLKMPVRICVQQMMVAIQQQEAHRLGQLQRHQQALDPATHSSSKSPQIYGRYRQVWIASRFMKLSLWCYRHAPLWFLRILRRWIGPKRMELFRQGLDLYDPQSWIQRRAKNEAVPKH